MTTVDLTTIPDVLPTDASLAAVYRTNATIVATHVHKTLPETFNSVPMQEEVGTPTNVSRFQLQGAAQVYATTSFDSDFAVVLGIPPPQFNVSALTNFTAARPSSTPLPPGPNMFTVYLSGETRNASKIPVALHVACDVHLSAGVPLLDALTAAHGTLPPAVQRLLAYSVKPGRRIHW